MRHFKKTLILLVVLGFSAFVVNQFFFRDSGFDKTQVVKETYDLKETITYLQLNMMNKEAVSQQPSYQGALQAEAIGDTRFETGEYLEAKQAYSQALRYLKLAIDEFNAKTPEKPADGVSEASHAPGAGAVPKPQQHTDNDFLPTSITDRQAEIFHTAPIDNTIASPEVLASVNKSLPEASSESIKTGSLLPDNSIEKSLEEKDATHRENTVQAYSHIRTQSRNAPNFAINRRDKDTDDIDSPKRYTSGADRDSTSSVQIIHQKLIATSQLIDAYKNNLALKNLNGLKSLFQEDFTELDENAWSKFFTKVKDVSVKIDNKTQSIKIFGNEVDLSIKIDYANHRGVWQKPLVYSERWTLAPYHDTWTVASRRFDNRQMLDQTFNNTK